MIGWSEKTLSVERVENPQTFRLRTLSYSTLWPSQKPEDLVSCSLSLFAYDTSVDHTQKQVRGQIVNYITESLLEAVTSPGPRFNLQSARHHTLRTMI
jgi:hypothetical protein